jgi:aspartyl-tRNA(Asn)/glutamyl-tRNA(Gln) amidotransferase subunit A
VTPHELSVARATRLIREGKLTASALVDACLARIEETDPAVMAWVTVDREGARAAAAHLDAEAAAGRLAGPLHGIPVGLKDIIHAAGLRTTAGARGFADTIPAADAVAVARLRAAGAVILGKTHTTEFAYADPPMTRNPWSRERTPGGSSSGSAAAVAARMVPAALGSQTVGSVLRPAAYCGVVGFKPTYGRISRRGVLPLAWSLDHVGVLARGVADAALLFAALAGPDPEDPGSLVRPVPDVQEVAERVPDRPPRLGLIGSPFRERAAPEMVACLERVASWLRSRGAAVEPVALPAIVGPLHAAIQVVVRAEAAAAHAELHRAHADRYRPRIRAVAELGQCVSAGLYLRAQRVRALARRELAPVLAAHDAVLMPAAPGPPPDPSTTGDPSFNAPWTGIGAPAIALPMGLADGLPLGLQLAAAPGRDGPLLAAARWVEDALDFWPVPPPSALG